MSKRKENEEKVRVVSEGLMDEDYFGKKKSGVVHVPKLFSCSRCGYNHQNLEFKKLKYPCGESNYWAMCPRVKQPIMAKVEVDWVKESESE